MRQQFTMTDEQFARAKDAMKPVTYMVFGGMAPRSPQENANDFWRSLGTELGFAWDSVRPHGDDPKNFTAEVAAQEPHP